MVLRVRKLFGTFEKRAPGPYGTCGNHDIASFFFFFFFFKNLRCHGCHRSGNSQGKKNFSRSGKSQGISLWVRENLHLWKKSGKSEILRVLIYLLPSQWCFCMVKNASCQCQGERQADVRFPRKSILFPCYVKELSIHVHCVCLAESINKWVERMAVRGGWRPLSGLICEIVNSVGQGNFTFVREKSGNFKHLWLWQPWMWLVCHLGVY